MKARLNRLFAADGRCFDVAVDHGFFGEASFLAGIEDMEATVATLVDAAPDAIQLSPGPGAAATARSRARSRRSCCAPTSRTSTARSIRRSLFSELVAGAVEQALALDAACVVVNLLLAARRARAPARSASATSPRCRPRASRVGMPLMVEPLVFKPGERGYGVGRRPGEDRAARPPGGRARRRRDQGRLRPTTSPTTPACSRRRRRGRCSFAAAAGRPRRRCSRARAR